LALPEPVAGMVIRYSYLWEIDHRRGAEEGEKDRPCAIVLVADKGEDGTFATVLPITHRPPGRGDKAIEIPAATEKRLKLDDERSWIVLTEANRFHWPGPDLRRANPRDPGSFVFGQLPYALFVMIRDGFLGARDRNFVNRTE